MKLDDLIERLEELKDHYNADGDMDIEIHFQPNYPLKGKLQNVRVLNGKIAIAASAGTEYGSEEAWEEE